MSENQKLIGVVSVYRVDYFGENIALLHNRKYYINTDVQ